MAQCPHCQTTKRQVKNGMTTSGSQIYRCRVCDRKYVPNPKTHGYPRRARMEAIRMVMNGCSLRYAARELSVSHVTVGNWLKEYNKIE